MLHGSSNERAQPVFPPARKPTEPVGIGLRHPYHREVLDTGLEIGWLEVHPENYFGGGLNRHFLTLARKKFQVSFHAVGLSLGSDQPVHGAHLQKLKELIDIYQPFHVSDHASWSASGNAHLNDLMPLPYTQETLDALCRNVEQTQNYLGRTILVENPSTYVAYAHNEMSEFEFMNRLADKTGCGLLLDINNIYVQACNHAYSAHDYSAHDYIDGINGKAVRELHLAGHTERQEGNSKILIDTHNQPVCNDVWDLYGHAIKRLGAVHTLIEWDQDFPALDVLVSEADKARRIIHTAERVSDAAE